MCKGLDSPRTHARDWTMLLHNISPAPGRGEGKRFYTEGPAAYQLVPPSGTKPPPLGWARVPDAAQMQEAKIIAVSTRAHRNHNARGRPHRRDPVAGEAWARMQGASGGTLVAPADPPGGPRGRQRFPRGDIGDDALVPVRSCDVPAKVQARFSADGPSSPC
ncbi:hypothetical protein VUR80DRAFT_4406 [Thermomyces stellatus]